MIELTVWWEGGCRISEDSQSELQNLDAPSGTLVPDTCSGIYESFP